MSGGLRHFLFLGLVVILLASCSRQPFPATPATSTPELQNNPLATPTPQPTPTPMPRTLTIGAGSESGVLTDITTGFRQSGELQNIESLSAGTLTVINS